MPISFQFQNRLVFVGADGAGSEDGMSDSFIPIDSYSSVDGPKPRSALHPPIEACRNRRLSLPIHLATVFSVPIPAPPWPSQYRVDAAADRPTVRARAESYPWFPSVR